MKHKSMSISCLIIISSWISVISICMPQNKWPEVVPIKQSFHLSDKNKIETKLTIYGKDKRPLYLLQCYLNAMDRKDKDFDYTGAFECRLTSLFDDYYAHRNLLTSETPQNRDWHSRGVFQIAELQQKKVEGVEIQYPGRGKARYFSLRGMQISIIIKNLTLSPARHGHRQKLNDLCFEVSIISDTSAQTEVDKPLNYSDPQYQLIKWPKIIHLQKKIHLSGHQTINISILGNDKKPLYVLYCCLNPKDEDEINGFEYSGDFHCFLFPTYENPTDRNMLLCDEQYPIRDWQGRGRFIIDELIGKCGEYPDYGRKREFRLRGIDLTLSITNLEMDSNNIELGLKRTIIRNLDLEVTAISDSTAISDIATPSKFMEPIVKDPKDTTRYIWNCDSVRLRNEP